MKVFHSSKYKKRIVFVIPSLMGGGAEKAAINLANTFANNNYKVQIIMIYKNTTINPLLNENILVTNLKCKKIGGSIFKLIHKLSNIESSIVISFITTINIAIGISKLFISKKHYYIFTQHEIPSLNPFITKRRNFYIPILMKILYPYADKIICVSRGLEREIRNFLEINLKSKIITINNCIEIRNSNFKKIKDQKKLSLLSVGRLVNSKDFETLIKAINMLKNELNIKLTIVGNGPQKKYLENLIRKLKIEEICQIKDFEIDIEKYYSKADIYISTSLYESFGNTIVEAMHHKLKIISTNCKYGPREILENGKWGELIKLRSPESIVNSIKKISIIKSTYNYEEVIKKFSSETILKKYENMKF